MNIDKTTTLYINWSKHENDLMVYYPNRQGKYLSKNLKEYLGLEDDCEVVQVTIMETGQIVDILDKIDQQLLTEHSFLKGYIRGLKDRLVPEEQPVFERGGQIFVKKLPEIVPKKSKNNQK